MRRRRRRSQPPARRWRVRGRWTSRLCLRPARVPQNRCARVGECALEEDAPGRPLCTTNGRRPDRCPQSQVDVACGRRNSVAGSPPLPKARILVDQRGSDYGAAAAGHKNCAARHHTAPPARVQEVSRRAARPTEPHKELRLSRIAVYAPTERRLTVCRAPRPRARRAPVMDDFVLIVLIVDASSPSSPPACSPSPVAAPHRDSRSNSATVRRRRGRGARGADRAVGARGARAARGAAPSARSRAPRGAPCDR